jgi:hypothetical protein
MTLRHLWVSCLTAAAMAAGASPASGQALPPDRQVATNTQIVPLTGTHDVFVITGNGLVTSHLVSPDAQLGDLCAGAGALTNACIALRTALATLSSQDPCRNLPTGTATDPCRIIAAAVAARATATGVSCTLLGVAAAAARPGTSTVLNMTGRALFNPFNALDPCRALPTVPLGFDVTTAPNGTILTAKGRAGDDVVAPPGAPTQVVGERRDQAVSLSWLTGPSNGSKITKFVVEIRAGTTIVGQRDIVVPDPPTPVTPTVISGLINGTAYRFRVAAVNRAGQGPFSALSEAVTPATVPGKPVIGTPTSGVAGGAVTATANWSPPAGNGGAVITGYLVSAINVAADGVTPVGVPLTVSVSGTTRSHTFSGLVSGQYVFEVSATNIAGTGPPSDRSAAVTAA